MATQTHLPSKDEASVKLLKGAQLLGAGTLNAAATHTGDELGDGTTSSTVLALAIFQEAETGWAGRA